MKHFVLHCIEYAITVVLKTELALVLKINSILSITLFVFYVCVCHFSKLNEKSFQQLFLKNQYELGNSLSVSKQEAKLIILVSLGQFHQYFTRPFFVQKFVQSQTLSREKLHNWLSYKK